MPPLEFCIDMDYNANINRIVCGQPRGNRLNVLKSFYVREFEIIFKKVKSRKISNLQRVAIKWSPVKIM